MTDRMRALAKALGQEGAYDTMLGAKDASDGLYASRSDTPPEQVEDEERREAEELMDLSRLVAKYPEQALKMALEEKEKQLKPF